MKKINKRIARKLFEENKPFVIVGDNVNEYHIIGGWHCGMIVDPRAYPDYTFDNMVQNFQFYLEPELGRRAAFYVV